MKSYEKAIEYFSKKFIGEDDKQRGQKYNNLGSCYAHLDQPRLSLSNYAEALKIYSEYP
jgi:tetratricopeptide (TPR) repeat protein